MLAEVVVDVWVLAAVVVEAFLELVVVNILLQVPVDFQMGFWESHNGIHFHLLRQHRNGTKLKQKKTSWRKSQHHQYLKKLG